MIDMKYLEALMTEVMDSRHVMEEYTVRIQEGLARISEQLAAIEHNTKKAEKAAPPEDGYNESFERFWTAYPKHRRNYKPKCYKFWTKRKLNQREPEVMAALEADKRDTQWVKDGGMFIPGALKWLQAERWNGAITDGHARPSSLAELDAIEAQFGLTVGPPQV